MVQGDSAEAVGEAVGTIILQEGDLGEGSLEGVCHHGAVLEDLGVDGVDRLWVVGGDLLVRQDLSLFSGKETASATSL